MTGNVARVSFVFVALRHWTRSGSSRMQPGYGASRWIIVLAGPGEDRGGHGGRGGLE
jgi:hypothetical protein